MKDASRQQESFVVRKGLLWALVPKDPDHCPLLTELCGERPQDVKPTWEDWPTLADALRSIRESAAAADVKVKVCGDIRRQPTVILTRKALPVSQPAATEQRINLKWCVFGEHRESWQENGHGLTLEALESLQPGQWLRLVSSPSKECRSASVVIRRTGRSSWAVDGVITDAWDELDDLADTLKVLLEHQLKAEDGPVPDDDIERMRYVQAYNARHGTSYVEVMDESYFHSLIPMSASAGGPGIDLEFSRRVRGNVDRLIKALSDEEDKLIEMAKREFDALEFGYDEIQDQT